MMDKSVLEVIDIQNKEENRKRKRRKPEGTNQNVKKSSGYKNILLKIKEF